MRFDNVYLEISGVCNARCPWCVTGNRLANSPKKIMPYEDFVKTIERLFSLDLISDSTVINLYNWGEPLIHPRLEEVLSYLHSRKIKFGLSTNCSTVLKFKQYNIFECLQHVIISMPGFSQSSYDKIHGFNFNRITDNIIIFKKQLHEMGFNRNISVAYHIYQFNIDEIPVARRFCANSGIGFLPSYAYINDFNLSLMYLENNLPYDLLKTASKQLFLHYIDELLKKQPDNYSCPQFNCLVIDEYSKVLTCCGIPKNNPDYSIGSIFELDKNEILSKKKSQKFCNKCIKSGLAYWVHNPITPEWAKPEFKTGALSIFKKLIPARLKMYIKKLFT